MTFLPLRPVVFLFLFFAIPTAFCRAEKIILKDGKEQQAESVRREKGSLRVTTASGEMLVPETQVARVENNNGALSRLGCELLSEELTRCITTRDYRAAVGICGSLLEVYPDNTDLRYLRALLNQKAGNTALAASDYMELVKAGSPDAKIYNNLGAILAKDQRFMEAQDYFLESMAKDPGSVDPVYNLGVAYMNLRDYGKARAQWEKALQLAPDDEDAKKALESIKGK